MTPSHTLRRLSAAAALSLAFAATAQAAPLYSNGAVVDGTGLSVLVAPGSTLGWGAQTASNNRVAEDFTVPLGSSWNVQSLSLYGYQTGASGFTFTSANWQIMSGDVNTGTVVSSGSAAVSNEGQIGYRVTDTTLANTQRSIYQMGVDIPDVELGAGSYWLTWNIGGTLASGPWVLPTVDSVSGNAMQSVAGGNFAPAIDTGTQRSPELAFALNGSRNATVPEPSSWALVLAAGLAAGWSKSAAAGRRAH